MKQVNNKIQNDVASPYPHAGSSDIALRYLNHFDSCLISPLHLSNAEASVARSPREGDVPTTYIASQVRCASTKSSATEEGKRERREKERCVNSRETHPYDGYGIREAERKETSVSFINERKEDVIEPNANGTIRRGAV